MRFIFDTVENEPLRVAPSVTYMAVRNIRCRTSEGLLIASSNVRKFSRNWGEWRRLRVHAGKDALLYPEFMLSSPFKNSDGFSCARVPEHANNLTSSLDHSSHVQRFSIPKYIRLMTFAAGKAEWSSTDVLRIFLLLIWFLMIFSMCFSS